VQAASGVQTAPRATSGGPTVAAATSLARAAATFGTAPVAGNIRTQASRIDVSMNWWESMQLVCLKLGSPQKNNCLSFPHEKYPEAGVSPILEERRCHLNMMQ